MWKSRLEHAGPRFNRQGRGVPAAPGNLPRYRPSVARSSSRRSTPAPGSAVSRRPPETSTPKPRAEHPSRLESGDVAALKLAGRRVIGAGFALPRDVPVVEDAFGAVGGVTAPGS